MSEPLYLVGGTWRALASYAMEEIKHPLTDPHGFELDGKRGAAARQAHAAVEPGQARP